MSRKAEPFFNPGRYTLTGSMLTVPGQSLERWQVLATSANGKYFLVRRISIVGQELKPTGDLATVPVHRVSPKDLMVESDFWLSVFPGALTIHAPEPTRESL